MWRNTKSNPKFSAPHFILRTAYARKIISPFWNPLIKDFSIRVLILDEVLNVKSEKWLGIPINRVGELYMWGKVSLTCQGTECGKVAILEKFYLLIHIVDMLLFRFDTSPGKLFVTCDCYFLFVSFSDLHDVQSKRWMFRIPD